MVNVEPRTLTQRLVLDAVIAAGERGITARQAAHAVWPDDPAWHKRTAGRGASGHNGAQGATMPLRAGRVLRALEDQRLIERHHTSENRWVART